MATAIVVSALGVLISRDIVRMAVWLLFTLIGVSLIYFLLGAEFLGAAQLIVYVGGTLVLVVFGVMLTASGPLRTLRTRPLEWVIAGVVGSVLFALLAAVSLQVSRQMPPSSSEDLPPGIAPLGLSFLGFSETASKASLGGVPSSMPRTPVAYLLPFEILSVHLLVVLIGAAYLARAKRRKVESASKKTGEVS